MLCYPVTIEGEGGYSRTSYHTILTSAISIQSGKSLRTLILKLMTLYKACLSRFKYVSRYISGSYMHSRSRAVYIKQQARTHRTSGVWTLQWRLPIRFIIHEKTCFKNLPKLSYEGVNCSKWLAVGHEEDHRDGVLKCQGTPWQIVRLKACCLQLSQISTFTCRTHDPPSAANQV